MNLNYGVVYDNGKVEGRDGGVKRAPQLQLCQLGLGVNCEEVGLVKGVDMKSGLMRCGRGILGR